MSKAIPEGWKKQKLIEVAQPISYGVKPFEGYRTYIATADLNGHGIIGGVPVTYENRPSRADLELENGNVIFARMKETVKVLEVLNRTEKYIFSTGFAGLKPQTDLVSGFLKQFFLSKEFNRLKDSLCTGSTQMAITSDGIEQIDILLPPFPEQHKIAAILGSVDKAIEKTRAVIEQTRSLKRAMMQELLTRGIPGRYKKFKKTPVGEIPEEWEVVRLEKAILSGPQNGLYRHESDYGNGTRIVRIDCFNDGKFYNTDFKRVNISENDIALYKVEFRDILINRVNSMSHLGKAAIFPMIDEPTVFESNMMRIRLDENMMLPEYAILWLCSRQIKKQIEDSAKKAIAQCSINQTDVKNFLFPCPSIGEQMSIVKAFTVMESFYNANVKQLVGKETLKGALMQNLLTGQIRVKG